MKRHVFQEPRLQNLLRGALSNTDPKIRRKTINNARKILRQYDAYTFAAQMCESDLDEFYYGHAFPTSLATVYSTPVRRPVPLHTECILQSYRIHHNIQKLLEASTSIGQINTAILNGDLANASTMCDAFIRDFGYSATLSRKVIYINLLATAKTAGTNTTSTPKQATALLQQFFPKVAPALYSQFINLTLDICNRDVDCFETLRDHLRLFKELSDNPSTFFPDYALVRKILFPTTYHSIIDPHCLLFMSSSSAIDLLVDLTTASHHSHIGPPTLNTLFSHPDFIQAKAHLQPSVESLHTFLKLPHPRDLDQAAYRASAIFPEVPAFARWRYSIDFEFHIRESIPLPGDSDTPDLFSPDLQLADLCTPRSGTLHTLSHFDNSTANAFFRTVAVLNCIRHGDSLSNLTPSQIRVLLSHTTGFSRLLTKDELVELRRHSEKEEADVVVFLSMVMLHHKEPHEDLAFDMRMAFQQVVMQSHDADIVVFLDWLHERTPNLCPVVVDLCDIAFLERLYLLNATYAAVLTTREQICRWTAKTLDWPEYESIADRLALDSKVRMIREGIDEARIFVDVLRYKQWAFDVLSPILRKFERVVSVASATSDDKARSVRTTTPSPKARQGKLPSSDYWFYQASDRAFAEFCHNRLFGIDSYLSRRIRHGTLAGTLIVPIQQKIEEFLSSPSVVQPVDDPTATRVLNSYRRIVATIRDDLLHFQTEAKPRGLFNPNPGQTNTRARIRTEFRDRLVELFGDGYTATEAVAIFPGSLLGPSY